LLVGCGFARVDAIEQCEGAFHEGEHGARSLHGLQYGIGCSGRVGCGVFASYETQDDAENA
jgi:hypothetical protein